MIHSIKQFFLAILESIQEIKEYKAKRYVDKIKN